MADSKASLTRQQLYDLVWSMPATKVGLDYGISGNAVAKACAKLNIPRPQRGYWAKIAFGKRVRKLALPPLEKGGRDSTTLGEFAEKRRNLPAIEAPPIASVPEEAMTKLHPAVQKTRMALRGAERNRDTGTLFGKAGFPHISMSVTKDALERALTVLNQVAWHLEGNGFDFIVPENAPGSLELEYRPVGTRIAFSLREVVERYEREITAEERAQPWIWDRWRYRATGRLRVSLSEYYPEGGRKSWGDGKTQKLEDQVSEIVQASSFVQRPSMSKSWNGKRGTSDGKTNRKGGLRTNVGAQQRKAARPPC